MVKFSHSTWPSSMPATLSNGQMFNMPISQQKTIPMDISQLWRWPRTTSNSWTYRAYNQVVLRFSLSTVCSYFWILFFPTHWLSFFIDSYMQPAPQSFGNFPTTHGKTASFFLDEGVQQEFAFIPDDGSATYVINVEVSFSLSVIALNFWCKLRCMVVEHH